MKSKTPKQPKTPKKAFPKISRRANDDAFDSLQEFTIAVAIEWDGNPPRMTWYDRLHRKGIRVRGGENNEFPSPLARRQSLDKENFHNGIVYQEGLYLVRNESLAKELAFEAQQFGASSVMIGHLFMSVFTAGAADIEVLQNYFQATSKRGRKPIEQAGTYTVTCLDELLTYEAELEMTPMDCPVCHSFRFFAHSGKQKIYQTPKWDGIDNLFEYWLCSRFDENGVFEIPLLKKATRDDILFVPPLVPHTDMLEPVVYLPDAVKMPSELQLQVWDACYSIAQMSETDRTHARLNVLGAYWNAGGDDTDFSMSEPEGAFDLIDMCILLRDTFSKYLWKNKKQAGVR